MEFLKKKRVIWLGVGLGVLYWMTDAALDSFVFQQGDFWPNVYSPDSMCLWMRMINSGIIIALASYAQSLLAKKTSAEMESELSMRQQKAILNNIPDIAWLKDRESRFISVNEPFGKACGVEPEKLAGKTDFDIWPADLAERYRADDREVMETGGRKQVVEPLENRDCKKLWIETIKTPIYSEKGEVIGTTGIARDITERKRTEEELKTYREHLEKLVEERTAEIQIALNCLTDEITARKAAEAILRENEAKARHIHGIKLIGEMAAAVAHEVRNPLHALMSVTEALREELKDNAEVDLYIHHIHQQIERLSLLMKDLLDLGKPVEPANLHRESLVEICGAAVDQWKHMPQGQGRRVGLIAAKACAGIYIIADSQRLQQVILNLFDNAAHHSPKNEEISVVIEEPIGEIVRFKVVDRGTGVPEEFLPKIFDPFFSTRRGGTGLGLNIVKNIVESHGGSIVMSNNAPAAGCTAEITMPLAGEACR